MTHVLGTRVPAGTGASEICHHFVARWMQARGLIAAGVNTNVTQAAARALLFGPGRGQPARMGGAMLAQRCSIVGFWDDSGNLQHSMIAVASTNWIGANNTGCFGTPGGRHAIQGVDAWISGAGGQHFGWIGADNRWQGQYQQLYVTFRNVR